MKKNLRFTMLVVVLAALGAMTGQAAEKVQICHLPPGNPDNFHTITVPESRLSAHLAHGDLAGNCSDLCDTLCDDGNACTQDHNNDCEEQGCLADPGEVNCDDSLLCTTDSCDPLAGCQYAPIVCDDEDNCTFDTCNPADGQCVAPAKDCGSLGVCVAETGDCDYPCDGITCDPIDQCHAAGSCVLPGECVAGSALADGTACDDGDANTANDQCSQGVCSGEPVTCPCDFRDIVLNALFNSAPSPTCFDNRDIVSSEPDPNGGDDLVFPCFDNNSDPCKQYFIIGDSDGSSSAAVPIAIVEYISFWNIPDSAAPSCAATDFANWGQSGEEVSAGRANIKHLISEEEADACAARLKAWASSQSLDCPVGPRG